MILGARATGGRYGRGGGEGVVGRIQERRNGKGDGDGTNKQDDMIFQTNTCSMRVIYYPWMFASHFTRLFLLLVEETHVTQLVTTHAGFLNMDGWGLYICSCAQYGLRYSCYSLPCKY